MKKAIKLIGIIALAAVIGFSMVSCGGDDDKVITLPKTVSGAAYSDGYRDYVVDFTFLSFNTLNSSSPVTAAGSVTVTTNLPSPNNRFTLTTADAVGDVSTKQITGLTSDQELRFTVTTTTGGLDLELRGYTVNIRLSLDGKGKSKD